MMLCVFIIIAVSTSFAVAHDCFDSQKYIDKVQPIHEECKKAVATVVKDKDDCDFSYFVWAICHTRACNINNKFQQIDHTKYVDLLKQFAGNFVKDTLANRLAVCSNEILIHDGSVAPYFDCLQKRCPEVANVRADYENSAEGICKAQL